MTITPILAEDYGPLLFLISSVLVCFAAFGFVCLAIAASVGRGKWWGFVLGLIPVIGGGLVLLCFLCTVGGSPMFFKVTAAVPLVCGLLSLYLWGLDRQRWSHKFGILALRVLLYGCIVLGALYLFALWVRR